jgi:thiazole synthase ThiGH ThiG subunit
MPDPMAAKRLMEIGCKISYQKTHLLEAREIKKPDDIRPGTKKGYMDRKAIWIVEVQMPKKLVFDIYKGYMNKMREELGDDGLKTQPSTPLDTNAATQLNTAPAAAPVPGGAPMGGAPASGSASPLTTSPPVA